MANRRPPGSKDGGHGGIREGRRLTIFNIMR
jgi:hypothetical protein